MFDFKCSNCGKTVDSKDGSILKICPECKTETLYLLPLKDIIAEKNNVYSKKNFYKNFILIELEQSEISYTVISEEKLKTKQNMYKSMGKVTLKKIGYFSDANDAKTYVKNKMKINSKITIE